LICDRNIVQNISWNTLNSQGFVDGVTTTIDGVLVKLRLPSGGEQVRESGNGYSGGTPTDNEWDTIIQNEGGYSGLPTPVAADKTSSANTDGANNQLWHWADMRSFCKENHAKETSYKVCRGGNAVSLVYITLPSENGLYTGFRPILEVLGLAPVVSGLSGSVGSSLTPFTIPYSVSDPDAKTFSLVEQLDGAIIRSLTDQSAGNFALDLSSLWDDLSFGTHKFTVTATDPDGGVGTSTATFYKQNPSPKSPFYSFTNGSRIPVSGYIEFTPREDPNGDTLTAALVYSENSDFNDTTNRTVVTDGLQKWDGASWNNVTNIPPSAVGIKHRFPYSGLSLNTTRYFYVRVSDGSSTVLGLVRALKVGTTLRVQTPVYTAAAMPTTVKVVLDAILSSGASVTQILVCNNANDAAPTWEDATSAYNAGGSAVYTFTNASKTAGSWGCAARVTISAGTATGEISLAKVSLGVLM
jgi:hypothetical protein